MSALILGATGLCGASLLKYSESSNKFPKIYTIARRALPFASSAVQIVEKDSVKWAQLFPNDDIKFLFTGLATTRGAEGGFDRQYKIDHDLNIELAKVAKEKGCSTIVVVSSVGASESSMFAYFKMKGQIERDILALGFDRTIILRPGGLLGDRSTSKGFATDLAAKISGLFYRTRLQKWMGYPIYGQEVGKVGVYLALHPSTADGKDKKVQIVESSEMLDIAAKIGDNLEVRN